jgi:hypothetical protein
MKGSGYLGSALDIGQNQIEKGNCLNSVKDLQRKQEYFRCVVR